MDVIHPSSRIADLVGLLYVLINTFRGKTDLYQLEKEMEVDLDDLMPIVYSADSLGFITIGEGDIVVTDKGLEFVRAGLKHRKEIIRNSIVKVEPFATAVSLGAFTLEALIEELRRKGVKVFDTPSGMYDLEVTLTEWGVYSGLLRKEENVYKVTL
ncbi:ABC transporter ATP-binding protein [Sulfodiicoccus acidiphilus]|uniref:ABC transporter ATP-binding protein n=1 Tax=Sulfodiicoccus acidiphilus TaxID=1670455 RepID=A0A348B0R5_9CREN|nr:AAA-associated domain-containing protein [Sulfodiicoccus acidiphilus]BBD71767.1 ABC transporter ATP-binding protein [Sulfodiicoccus acidiphilus]GGT99094.1 ABC transporter ATP-binding protein [Sulfodiicoccus acidiphilus]